MIQTFGHIYLSIFFKKLFQLTEQGIIYNDVVYSWDQIQKIEKSFGSFLLNLFMYSRGCPGATIYFDDGKKMRINARIFTKQSETPEFDISGFFTSESKAFLQFFDFLDNKIKDRNS